MVELAPATRTSGDSLLFDVTHRSRRAPVCVRKEIRARHGDFPDAPVWNISLAGIFSRDVTLQLLNRMFLSGDDPLHKIADGEYTLHGPTLDDR